ncbi:MAG TPA: Rha family transcriptional regulator, partial [Arsenophonus nasoniae]
MSSLEMVDYINADRKSKAEAEGLTFPCKKYRKLQHNDFLKKVPKVLGETSGKFFSDDIFTAGNGAKATRRIYRFPKREACLMAMSYSYELQAKIYDKMTELEKETKNINHLGLSGLTSLTIQQMQDRIVLAEK